MPQVQNTSEFATFLRTVEEKVIIVPAHAILNVAEGVIHWLHAELFPYGMCIDPSAFAKHPDGYAVKPKCPEVAKPGDVQKFIHPRPDGQTLVIEDEEPAMEADDLDTLNASPDAVDPVSDQLAAITAGAEDEHPSSTAAAYGAAHSNPTPAPVEPVESTAAPEASTETPPVETPPVDTRTTDMGGTGTSETPAEMAPADTVATPPASTETTPGAPAPADESKSA